MKKIVLAMLIAAVAVLNTACPPKWPTEPTGDTISFSSSAVTAASNYVKMEQASTNGDTVTIRVKAVSIAEPVGGMAVDITYDAARLEFLSASNGNVISGDTSSFAATDNNGTVVIDASDVTDASPMASGTLFTVKFKGIATGNGSVGISNHTLFNASGNSISGISWYGGTVTVQ